MGARIRVLIVAPWDLQRAGIRGLLSSEPDFEIVGSTSSGFEAVSLIEGYQPNVVVIDRTLIGEARPRCRVGHQTQWVVIENRSSAFKRIPDAHIVYWCSPRSEWIRVIREAAAGNSPYGASATFSYNLSLLPEDLMGSDSRCCSSDFHLSPLELRLLNYLIMNKHRIVTYEELLAGLWRCFGEYCDRHLVIKAVSRLRRRIPGLREALRNVRGVGYQWSIQQSCRNKGRG